MMPRMYLVSYSLNLMPIEGAIVYYRERSITSSFTLSLAQASEKSAMSTVHRECTHHQHLAYTIGDATVDSFCAK